MHNRIIELSHWLHAYAHCVIIIYHCMIKSMTIHTSQWIYRALETRWYQSSVCTCRHHDCTKILWSYEWLFETSWIYNYKSMYSTKTLIMIIITLFHVYVHLFPSCGNSFPQNLACAIMLAVWCDDVCVIIYSLIYSLIICTSLFMSLQAETPQGGAVADI